MEHQATNLGVGGSNPSGRTTEQKNEEASEQSLAFLLRVIPVGGSARALGSAAHLLKAVQVCVALAPRKVLCAACNGSARSAASALHGAGSAAEWLKALTSVEALLPGLVS